MKKINLKKNVLLASLIASIPFASPFVIKASSALTGSVLMLSSAEKVHANERSDFYFDRAFNKAENGDSAGAIVDYTKSIEIDPHKVAYYNRALSKQKLNDFSGAIADYTKAIELDPEY